MVSKLTIRIDKELEQLLENASIQSGRSKSELVRQAIKRQLSRESFQQLRKELLPHGEKNGWLTDEDVFLVAVHSCIKDAELVSFQV
jgi:predicted transcriptional regulator